MATFKILVLPHQLRQDGTYNVKIRVTHNRRVKYISTQWYLNRNDLTRSMTIKNQQCVDSLEDVVREYRHRCNMIATSMSAMSVDDVVDYLLQPEPQKFALDFITYCKTFVKRMADKGHEGNAKSYKAAINNLEKFLAGRHLDVNDITLKFLNEWVAWIKESKSYTSGRETVSTAWLYPSKISTIFTQARREFNDEDVDEINIPRNPFARLELPRYQPVRQRALTMEQLKAIATMPYSTYSLRYNFVKDVFMISFFLMGMNEVDLFNATDIADGRITYCRTKTRNRRADNAEISIKIQPEAEALIERYRDKSGRRVFDFYKRYSSVSTFIQSVNAGLKDIGREIGEERLQFYAARHTWATLAVNEAGVDKYAVHAGLNHVDPSMKITDVYIKKSWDTIDRANRQLLDYLQLK